MYCNVLKIAKNTLSNPYAGTILVTASTDEYKVWVSFCDSSVSKLPWGFARKFT